MTIKDFEPTELSLTHIFLKLYRAVSEAWDNIYNTKVSFEGHTAKGLPIALATIVVLVIEIAKLQDIDLEGFINNEITKKSK